MVSVVMFFHLLAYANIAVEAKLITIPLFKESCEVSNKRSNVRISKRAPFGNKPDPIRIVCREQNPNYGIVKIGSDQLAVHGNSPVNSDGSRYFKVMFDTGSTSTWVFGVPEPQKSDYIKSYYKSANYTAMPTVIQYSEVFGSGNYETFAMVYIDKICLANLCVFSQAIGIVSKHESPKMTHFEGIVGMGNFKDPTALTQYHQKIKQGEHSVMENVLKSHGLDAFFALWLSRTGGILSLGGPDKMYYHEPIIYTPVISNELQHWLIEGSHLLVNNRVINMSQVSVDSGADYIYVPEAVLEEIRDELNVDQHGFFRCHQIYTFPNIIIILPEYRVILTPEDYVIKNNIPLHDIRDPSTREWYKRRQEFYGTDRCVICFDTISSTKWTFGETFLRKVYTVFDVANQRVGFATPKSV